MWRPLEVFLYDWWPIRAEGGLLQRLSAMPVRIEYKEVAPADAWRSDWPEVPPADVPRRAPIETRARDAVTNPPSSTPIPDDHSVDERERPAGADPKRPNP